MLHILVQLVVGEALEFFYNLEYLPNMTYQVP